MTGSDHTTRPISTSPDNDLVQRQTPESQQWSDTLKVSGELIGATERAVTTFGADFQTLFRVVRLELADDYSFLDPFSTRFQYSNSTVSFAESAPVNGYVTGLSEALRRIVNVVATGDRARRVRERVALELAMFARAQPESLQQAGFGDELDRIAGTRVL